MKKYFAELLEEFSPPSFLEGGFPLFLEEVRKKYHYDAEAYESLCSVAEAMLSPIREEACWEHRLYRAEKGWESEVGITLGKGVDILQEQYLSGQLLSESYMVESLASELLLLGYAAYNRYVAEETPYHVARYHFLGSEEGYPIEGLGALLNRLRLPIVCNEAYCMMPKKSVAFVAELTKEAGVHCRGICVGCHSRNCPNRIPGVFS